MRTLEKVYYLRFLTGVLAAVLSIGYVLIVYGAPSSALDYGVLFNSLSLSIIVYVLSYYILKMKLKDKVAKVQKLFTTGIGIHFLAWIVFYVLFYTWLYAS
jgi:hypothetical protein